MQQSSLNYTQVRFLFFLSTLAKGMSDSKKKGDGDECGAHSIPNPLHLPPNSPSPHPTKTLKMSMPLLNQRRSRLLTEKTNISRPGHIGNQIEPSQEHVNLMQMVTKVFEGRSHLFKLNTFTIMNICSVTQICLCFVVYMVLKIGLHQ